MNKKCSNYKFAIVPDCPKFCYLENPLLAIWFNFAKFFKPFPFMYFLFPSDSLVSCRSFLISLFFSTLFSPFSLLDRHFSKLAPDVFTLNLLPFYSFGKGNWTGKKKAKFLSRINTDLISSTTKAKEEQNDNDIDY